MAFAEAPISSPPARAPALVGDAVAYWPAAALAAAGFATAAIARGRGPRLSPTARRVIAGGLGAATLFGFARWQLARHFTEKPSYEVAGHVGGIEIRLYPQRVHAETIVDSTDWDEALNEGFRRLAGYIFGGNETQQPLSKTAFVTSSSSPGSEKVVSEKIAMTAPVMSVRGEGGQTVAFVMPQNRALSSLPLPIDPRVRLREVPAHYVAAMRFTGRYNAAATFVKQRELFSRLRALEITPVAAPHFAGYDPPSTLPILRRNEVWVEIG